MSQTSHAIRDEHALIVEYRPVSGLTPYARNARTHSADQVQQLVKSIREFGFTNPVLIDADGEIIAGHGRVMAAAQVGMAEVPTITLGYLSDAQKRAYVIADNQLALNAGWNTKLLGFELDALAEVNYDLSVLGFTGNELTSLRGLGADFAPGSEDEQGALDVVVEITCPHCGGKFRRS